MSDVAIQSCPCGSGLRRRSCCGQSPPVAVAPEALRHLLPLIERAEQAQRQGHLPIAERLSLDVLELAPALPRALAVLYRLRAAGGPPAAAEALLRRLVAVEPNNFWATNELALLLLAHGNAAEAEQHARDAVRIAPEAAQAHNLLGMALTEARKPQAGEHHYRQVLALSEGRDAILLANLAWNLKTQGRMAESRALYAESLKAAPEVLQTLLGAARMEEADRNFAAAADLLDRAERVSPGSPSVLLQRAIVLGRTGAHEAALAVLERIARQSPGGLGPEELLEKGRLLDQMGRHDDAWAAFVEGKQRARKALGHSYMAEPAEALAARLSGFFVAGRLRTLPRAAPQEGGARPLFILGFPRSGTTLVEQTLSAHPRIAAGDELPLVTELAELAPRLLESPLAYPEALSELWMGDRREGLDLLRDHYLRRARQLVPMPPDAGWFTDKMPLNEFHLGLIGLVFPDAPLLHLRRHPLDVLVSVFANSLTHGFFCAYDLAGIARHYVLTHRLVAHYRAEMALRYLVVRYEDIVTAQEPSVRAMLDFIGAGFDPRCLRFEENRRHARTASYAQVTEKLHDRARFRYRAYLRHLEPVLPVLAPVIAELGYSV
jgi:tetratricopeptide (TPR) repeat protein